MFGGFEDAVEGGQTLKAGAHGYLGDGDVGLDQQGFRMGDPFLH